MALSKASKRDKKGQLIKGIQTHFAKAKTITLKGQVVSIPSLLAGLQTSIDAGKETDAKRTVYLEASKASQAADAAVDPTALALTEYLQSTMSATDLADFGITVKTRAVPDVATKAAANAQRLATRKARGTMGKKQKAKIVGVVEEPVVVAGATSAKAKTGSGTGGA